MNHRMSIKLHLIRDPGLQDRVLRSIWASPLPNGEDEPGIGTVVLWMESTREKCEEMQTALLEMGLVPSAVTVAKVGGGR